MQFLLNNCGTSVSTEGTVLFVVGTGLKHRNIGVSEIDVLDVLCLKMVDAHKCLASNIKNTKLFN